MSDKKERIVLSYWNDTAEGIIFIYVAENYKGDLITNSEEGTVEWIKLEDLYKIKQFSQNEKFTQYLFKKDIFEGKFLLDEHCNLIEYKIRTV